MRIVLKLGGSLLFDDKGEAIIKRVKGYAHVLKDLHSKGHTIVVIVGGGKPARMYINAARELGANESQCDWLGIKLARNNAELLSTALGSLAYPTIAKSLDELSKAATSDRIVLMGGLTPGQSTNAVAALVAESLEADFLFNGTNVDGVYDRDPKEGNAKKLDKVNIKKLREILSGAGTRAGEYKLFDPVAIRVVERSRITTVIFNGQDPTTLKRLVNGEKIGTIIVHEN